MPSASTRLDLTPALRRRGAALESLAVRGGAQDRRAHAGASRRRQQIIFETGYGPSGLPHIGTFGEVARTTMVRTAFRVLTEDRIPTRLICFSDDMDGLRKVPDNVPNKEMMAAHLNQPLTSVPDPFGEHAELRRPQQRPPPALPRPLRLRLRVRRAPPSTTAPAASTRRCCKMLEAYDEVMAIMLPSLGEERRETYSPFLPISPTTGAVLQVPILERKLDAGTIVYRDPDDRQAGRGAGDRRPGEVPVEGRLGAALGGARRRLRDVGQGPDRIRSGCRAGSAERSAASRRRASTTSSSSTRTARRFRSRRATA